MMRRHFCLFTLGFLAPFGAAINITLIDIVAEIPSCALGCVTTALPSSQTSLANLSSICSNVTVQASLSACIQGKCNYTEQIQVALFNSQLCTGLPVESRAWPLATVGSVSVLLALIAVALRCYSRYSNARRLSSDDWIIVAAAALLVTLVALGATDVLKNGFGRHVWDIDPQVIPSGLKIFYVTEILYILVMTMVKVSILLFYLRVFPSVWFRVADFTVLATVVASGISFILVIIFQCDPISGAWDQTTHSTCVNVNLLAFAAAGISVAQDVIVLILPIPACAKLHMNKRKKINVMFMFSLGGVACIISIIRLHYLTNFAKGSDPTWDNAFPAIWSFIEMCVATICTCLPAIRGLFSRLFLSSFDLTGTSFSSPSSSFSSSHHHEKLHFSDQSTQLAYPHRAAKKTGPNYNRFGIFTPDSELPFTAPEFGEFRDSSRFVRGHEEHESKMWINPRFYGERNAMESQGPVIERHDTQPSSKSSLFALEGPMIGDVEGYAPGTRIPKEKERDRDWGILWLQLARGMRL